MPDDPTLDFYARNAARYVAHGGDAPDPRLVAFVDELPEGAGILELGAGSGRDAAYMARRGMQVDATDASAALAEEAEKRLGKPVRLLRFDQLEALETYDAVWACASLLHAPASELTGDLARIFRALRPEGLFVASFKAGNGEGRDRFNRYYNYPDAETLLAHYRSAADWAFLSLDTVAGGGYDGQPTPWLWVTARK
ncbi:class I SAM-dependent methyltransferase [Devosia sp. YIM 151766]|uniref:class I SAM-dependent methyltransferase n=1 Tax=Devosia sp. YIM 151766 TaxID=3017325 RepID=UPI00255C4DC3|nr:class I SAM-dependent methyltransferase [Devosia sp. YIM 151766]WIY52681.1 class I SAM-dependent methyltransferase [Devosia sp. YIM 151766]